MHFIIIASQSHGNMDEAVATSLKQDFFLKSREHDSKAKGEKV